ncbi:MAG: hypothetical protein J7L54_07255 [Elusimicrobia bacterium]|nr:hypothetical protein [Elusimicrobiota bacterium]
MKNVAADPWSAKKLKSEKRFLAIARNDKGNKKWKNQKSKIKMENDRLKCKKFLFAFSYGICEFWILDCHFEFCDLNFELKK